MFELKATKQPPMVERMAAKGYWPAVAAKFLAEGRYSRAVEVCKEGLAEEPSVVSGRVVYAQALYRAGQIESAAEQFYQVLARDPENLMALKCLGDIKYVEGDHYAAMAHYGRVLEIDPGCRELCSSIRRAPGSEGAQETGPAVKENSTVLIMKASAAKEATRTMTLKREAEVSPVLADRGKLRAIPFYTETMGDLYLAQGHNRLAAQVYRELIAKRPSPQLQEKLEKAEGKAVGKE